VENQTRTEHETKKAGNTRLSNRCIASARRSAGTTEIRYLIASLARSTSKGISRPQPRPTLCRLENTVMPETTDTELKKVDPHLTARIVRNYVQHHAVGTGQVSELITSVHRALGRLGRPAQPEEVLTPAVSVRQSVRQDYVVCLDCGYRGKVLQRHIARQHGLSRDEYLKRWGLRRDHPLTAPGYSEQRSILAKELGLGHKVKAKAGPSTAATAPASIDADSKSETKPARRRSTRSASKSDVVSEAVAENAPASPRRSRSKSDPAARRRAPRPSRPLRRRTQ